MLIMGRAITYNNLDLGSHSFDIDDDGYALVNRVNHAVLSPFFSPLTTARPPLAQR
jgi:hypothetical protein